MTSSQQRSLVAILVTWFFSKRGLHSTCGILSILCEATMIHFTFICLFILCEPKVAWRDLSFYKSGLASFMVAHGSANPRYYVRILWEWQGNGLKVRWLLKSIKSIVKYGMITMVLRENRNAKWEENNANSQNCQCLVCQYGEASFIPPRFPNGSFLH